MSRVRSPMTSSFIRRVRAGCVRARVGSRGARREAVGEPVAGNGVYVRWLVGQSMLDDANALAKQLSGSGNMLQNPFAHPDPRAAMRRAAVWFTAYPLVVRDSSGSDRSCRVWRRGRCGRRSRGSGSTRSIPGRSKRAGGLEVGDRPRRSTVILTGSAWRSILSSASEDDFRHLCATAEGHGGVIIDDIVPGHTGKGADFRLAEMGYTDYPGIYHMVSIPREDWRLLPDVPARIGIRSI